MLTSQDLQTALSRLSALQLADANYSGNNPNKFRSDLAAAHLAVQAAEQSLKSQGLLAKSEKELLAESLDAAFPNARSRQVVTFKGQRFRRRFAPAGLSRSGKSVSGWVAWWELLGPVYGDRSWRPR